MLTKAAEVCHVSQPSLTAAIGNLEKELGYRLFNKKNNRLYLTSEGEAFRTLTENFLKNFDSYYAHVCDLSSLGHRPLKIGIPAILGTLIMEKIFPSVSVKYPDIPLEIFEVPTIDGIKMLNNAELDFLLGLKDTQSYSNCTSIEIFTTELCLAVSKRHYLACKSVITPDMLEDVPIVSVNKGSYHHALISNGFDVPLNIIMYSNQLSTIEYMIAENVAASVIYKNVFKDSDHITYVPFENPLTAPVHIFWQKNAYQSTDMKRIITYIKNLDFS